MYAEFGRSIIRTENWYVTLPCPSILVIFHLTLRLTDRPRKTTVHITTKTIGHADGVAGAIQIKAACAQGKGKSTGSGFHIETICNDLCSEQAGQENAGQKRRWTPQHILAGIFTYMIMVFLLAKWLTVDAYASQDYFQTVHIRSWLPESIRFSIEQYLYGDLTVPS